jgi:hypothetical protein
MAVIPNSQSFAAAASGMTLENLEPTWKAGIDAVMLGLGRDITLHLPPSKLPCNDAGCRFNSSYKKFMNADGSICRTCTGQGWILEPRQTVYRANIRWVDQAMAESDFQESNLAGRIMPNHVRTKTVAASYQHIQECVGATIDGINVELFEEPRYTGMVNVHYVVAIWKRVNR